MWYPETNRARLAVIGKLGEELSEASKICFRSMIQGIYEKDPKTGIPNIQSMGEELADVRALSKLLREFFDLDENFIEERAEEKFNHKKEWVEKLIKEALEETIQ